MYKFIIQTTNNNLFNTLQNMISKNTNEANMLNSVSFIETFNLITKNDIKIIFIEITDIIKEEIEKIINYDNKIKIVIIGNIDSFSFNIYDIIHSYYLVEPFNLESVKRCLNKIYYETNLFKKNILLIKYKNVKKIIELNDIKYIYSEGRYVRVVTNNLTYSVIDKLDNMINKLNKLFIRLHQSYIVNTNNISRITKVSCVLKCGIEIPISRVNYKILKDKIIKYNNENTTNFNVNNT